MITKNHYDTVFRRAETIYFLTWDVESGDKKNYIIQGPLLEPFLDPR